MHNLYVSIVRSIEAYSERLYDTENQSIESVYVIWLKVTNRTLSNSSEKWIRLGLGEHPNAWKHITKEDGFANTDGKWWMTTRIISSFNKLTVERGGCPISSREETERLGNHRGNKGGGTMQNNAINSSYNYHPSVPNPIMQIDKEGLLMVETKCRRMESQGLRKLWKRI